MPVTMSEFRSLRVGDVVYVPSKSPFSEYRRVRNGREGMTVDIPPKPNPSVSTPGLSLIFSWQVEAIHRFDDPSNEWVIDPHFADYAKRFGLAVGDPCFPAEAVGADELAHDELEEMGALMTAMEISFENIGVEMSELLILLSELTDIAYANCSGDEGEIHRTINRAQEKLEQWHYLLPQERGTNGS